MAKTFFENFKEAANIVNFPDRNPYSEANLPRINESNASWKERVAVPFSYQINESGDRRRGAFYVPAYEASKIKKSGVINAKELETYGADLDDGRSLTAKGFIDLYERVKDANFAIEGAQKEKPAKSTFLDNLRASARRGGLGL